MAEQAAQYKCEACGAIFKDADALTKHKAVHQTQAAPEDNKSLEQGTQPPTEDPSISPPAPGPMPPVVGQ